MVLDSWRIILALVWADVLRAVLGWYWVIVLYECIRRLYSSICRVFEIIMGIGIVLGNYIQGRKITLGDLIRD